MLLSECEGQIEAGTVEARRVTQSQSVASLSGGHSTGVQCAVQSMVQSAVNLSQEREVHSSSAVT